MQAQCTFLDCGKTVIARGWCYAHYQQWRRTGAPATTRRAIYPAVCTAPGCDRDSVTTGLCRLHYGRLQRRGSYELPKRATAGARFWQNVVKDCAVPLLRPDLGACWLWAGARGGNGYGYCRSGAATRLATHVAWEEAQGSPVPPGHELDHLCFKPLCVRPTHLEAVTPLVNSRRRRRAGRRKRTRS